jgi:MFS family permease
VMLSGRLYKTFGIRRSVRAGSFVFPLGALLLLFLTPHSHPALAAAASFLMGFGMGLVSITGIILVQESVEWSMRGSATASIIFSRSLGNTLGAAALGAILNVGIAHYGSGELAVRLRHLFNQPGGLAQLTGQQDVRMVLFHALYWSFWGVFAVALLAVLSAWLIPVGGKPNAQSAAEETSVPARDKVDASD